MSLKPWQEAVLLLVWGLAILALGYGPERSRIAFLIGISALSFLAYAFLANSKIAWKKVLLAAVLIRVFLLAADVNWTDDHFRYVFDGGVAAVLEESPYGTTPGQLAEQGHPLGEEFVPLVNHTDTYTVYPPFAQLVFFTSYVSGSGNSLTKEGATDIDSVVIALRTIILLMEVLTCFALLILLRIHSLPRRWLAWYALNPLVIMEFSVNMHTEVFMVTWCVLGLVAIAKKRYLLVGLFLGLAAAAKLWPLMFLAFLPTWVGWKKSVQVGLSALLVFVVLWIPFYTPGMIENVLSSIRLYFSYFEFNGSVYYIVKDLLPEGWVKGSSLIATITLLSILLLAVRAMNQKWRSVAEGMLWSLALYFAFASTVHPWYIIPLLVFASVTQYRWPFIWSALIIPTYLTYAVLPYEQPFWWLWLEYVVLFGVIALELMVHSTWGMKRRAGIKLERLIHMIPIGARVLDIGTGNGSLASGLKERGVNITSVDVRNRSCFPDVDPTLIDGASLPFDDDTFDVVLIITVLHHTRRQEELLTEAKRVGKELIVMEDVYHSRWQKYLTFLFDSLINLEFVDHPHSNRDEEQWEQLFDQYSLRIVEKVSFKTLLLFNQVIYRLAR